MNETKIRTHLRQWETEDMKSIAQLGAIDQLTAKNAMIAPVFLQETDDISTILKKLRHEDISACIVINNRNAFVGEISVEDIIKLFVQQLNTEPMIKYLTRGYKKGFLYKNAWELCNRHRCTVYEDTNINTVIRAIYTPKSLYVPVLNKQKQVMGVITPNSLINLLRHH
jgi:predicted transcriptional regulator